MSCTNLSDKCTEKYFIMEVSKKFAGGIIFWGANWGVFLLFDIPSTYNKQWRMENEE